MEIEILREIHRYRFAKRGRRFGSDVELMIVYGAAIAYLRLRDAGASITDLALP